MRQLIALTGILILSAGCFGQGRQNVVQTGTVDAHGANWIPPTSTFAAPPSSPAPGSVYIFTDASAVGACSGGGSALANCRWSGSVWSAVSGGPGGGGGTPGGSSGQAQINAGGTFAGQASIFNGGTLVQRAVECASGTVNSTPLTAAAANQEITIQTAVSGNVRWDEVTVSETTQFAGTTGLTVSMGRPGTNNLEMTGTLVPLMVSSGDTNYWTARPSPAQLTSTYPIVLNFAVTSGSVNTATAGTLTWEICGYSVR